METLIPNRVKEEKEPEQEEWEKEEVEDSNVNSLELRTWVTRTP